MKTPAQWQAEGMGWIHQDIIKAIQKDARSELLATLYVSKKALEKCQKTFLTLEKLKGFSTEVPPNIVIQSMIKIALSLARSHKIQKQDCAKRVEEFGQVLKRIT